MEKARVELGPEAMLMSSKKTAAEARRLGAYEVVFGVAEEMPAAGESRVVAGGSDSGGADVLARELADLRKQIENVRRSVSRQGYSRGPATQRSVAFGELQEMLVGADFSEEIAHELVESVAARLPEPNPGAARTLGPELAASVLKEEIEGRLRISGELGTAGVEQRVVAFVGPSGAGKTTTLVKLALRYGVAARTPLQIFSADSMRVGGSEQLGAYARIMSAGFQAVSSMAALEQALEECSGKKLVLIDTPGYGAAEMGEAAEFKNFLARNPHVEVQLVLPATLRTSAVASVLGRFAIFHPAKVLFTHVEEAETPGAVLDAAIRSGLPVSFLSTGQQIPEDLEAASKARLTDKLFERVRAAALFAA